MREFTLDQLKPNTKQLNKINMELLAQVTQTGKKYRESESLPADLSEQLCLQCWKKLCSQDKIVLLGNRKWFMEWDD